MKKKTKIILNLFLTVALVSSIAWGTLLRGLGTWGSRTYTTWWNDDIFWANIFQIILPIGIVITLIFINVKKAKP